MENSELIKIAIQARENSYSPYSHFRVGAALLTKSGKVFMGTNVENCAYSPCNCAERSAIFAAISNGEREFEKLAIIGDNNAICYPCGVCRQVICELAKKATIICAKSQDEYLEYNIGDLLPNSFTSDNLK